MRSCTGTKKTVMPKKKVIAAQNLQDWTKLNTQNNEKHLKKKSSSFYATFLCFPDFSSAVYVYVYVYVYVVIHADALRQRVRGLGSAKT